jgi:predicted Zn-dependent protease
MARAMERRATAALALALGFSLSGCAINPATGENQLMLVSEQQGIAMGREADSAVIATIGLYADETWQSYMQKFGEKLAATSERPDLPWTFRVVDDPAVNAFAVPGGFVYVTRGLLTHLTSEAELASVVGHEIGHITARHTAAEMSKQQLIGAGLVVGSIASSQVAKYAGAASQALGILYLKYSRDDESQADELGLRYMRRANYDPRQMPEVFRMLEQMSAQEGGDQLPSWLATHPSPANRVDAISKQIAALPQDFSGTVVNRDSYLRRLDGQVFGEDPREGYFEGSRFLHPGMRFQVTFPEGWATQNGKQAVVAVSSAQDAVIELSSASEAGAAAAAQAFLGQEGIQAGSTSRGSVHGLTAVSAPFGAATANGQLKGTVLFVEYGGAVFRLLGYTPDAGWSTYQSAIEQALGSFQALTDPAALNRQPQRVAILKLDRPTTLEALARERPSPVSPATLALINQVELKTPLEAGRLVKWIVGPS